LKPREEGLIKDINPNEIRIPYTPYLYPTLYPMPAGEPGSPLLIVYQDSFYTEAMYIAKTIIVPISVIKKRLISIERPPRAMPCSRYMAHSCEGIE